jgi:hypothetical protein
MLPSPTRVKPPPILSRYTTAGCLGGSAFFLGIGRLISESNRPRLSVWLGIVKGYRWTDKSACSGRIKLADSLDEFFTTREALTMQ